MIKLSFIGTSEVVYLPIHDASPPGIPTAEEWMQTYIPSDFTYPFDTSSTYHSLSHLGVEEPHPFPPVRIGVLTWPTAACEFAHVHFIAGDVEVQRILDLTVQQSTNLPLYCQIEMDDGIGGVIKPLMFLLPPKPLQQIDGAEKLWLLSFVDARYFWWESKYRIRVETDSGVTFNSLLNTIASNLNLSLTLSSINSAYKTPSNRFDSDYQPSGLLLDVTMRMCGLRYAHQLNGSGIGQSFADAFSDEQTNLLNQQYAGRKLAGGLITEPDRVLPKTIYVLFGRLVCGRYETEPYVISVNLDDVRGELVALTNQYQTTEGVGNFTIVGDLDAIIPNDACSNPTNLLDLLAYAKQSAVDWWCWQIFREDLNYSGIVDYNIHAGIDRVEWTYSKSMVSTRVVRKPFNDRTLGTFRVSSEGGYLSSFLSPNDFQNERICPPCVQNVYAYSGSDNNPVSPTAKTIDIVTNVCIEFDSNGKPSITVQKKNFNIPFGMTANGPTECEVNPTNCCNAGNGGGGGGEPGVLPCCGTEILANRLVLTFAGDSLPDFNGDTNCCPCLQGTSWELFFQNAGYFGPQVPASGTQPEYPINCPDVTQNGGFVQEGANGINFILDETCSLGGNCPPQPPAAPINQISFGATTFNIISCNPFYAEGTMTFPVQNFGYTSPCCPTWAFDTTENYCLATVVGPRIPFVLTE